MINVERLQAVRTVFNIAIGATSADIQRTARNALLQMVNTVVKRVSLMNLVNSQSSSNEADTHPVKPQQIALTCLPHLQLLNGRCP